MLTTIDGRNISEETLRALFDEICTWIRAHDPEFNPKEMISFEFTYENVDQVNDYISAITFFVGGKTDVYMTPVDGSIICGLVNQGYYKNIGA